MTAFMGLLPLCGWIQGAGAAWSGSAVRPPGALRGPLRCEFGPAFADICDRVAVMSAGRIVESGPAEQILGNPQDPYTRTLLDAVLDDAPTRDPWQHRAARTVTA